MKELFDKFALKGEILSYEAHGNGHINSTYLVKTSSESYIFQLINHNVFPDIEMLMNNIALVTEHLRKKGIPTLEIVPTKEGKLYVKSGEDAYRCYKFIPNCVCYEKLPDLETVEEAARGFGQFHGALADIDASKLGEVIPNFHNTKSRFGDFQNAIYRNASGRLSTCEEEVDFLLSRVGDYSLIVDALAKGEIRNSVTHNDPKINNVAFDKDSNKVSCILDLDTVMPGSFLYDFGDGLRSLFTGDNEDNKDTSLLKVDLAIYRSYLLGYYPMMKEAMNKKEIELLPYSILIIAEELAMRFLGDYINGDTYFGVAYPTHNLVRARTQIALAKDIILHLDELKAIGEEICK